MPSCPRLEPCNWDCSTSLICTTNAIESVNMTLRKVTRNHRIFLAGEAVYEVVYLAM
jgi:transposase-like protein